MVVGRKMRFAVLVMAEASVPSRRRLALGAGSQGTVTYCFVRVMVFGRSGCQALVAAMAYIAGQQRRMVAMCCRLHSPKVLAERIVRRVSFSTGSAARVRLETGLWCSNECSAQPFAPAHTALFRACGCSRDSKSEKHCAQDPSRSRWKSFAGVRLPAYHKCRVLLTFRRTTFGASKQL